MVHGRGCGALEIHTHKNRAEQPADRNKTNHRSGAVDHALMAQDTEQNSQRHTHKRPTKQQHPAQLAHGDFQVQLRAAPGLAGLICTLNPAGEVIAGIQQRRNIKMFSLYFTVKTLTLAAAALSGGGTKSMD